jgi:hypothetical protein
MGPVTNERPALNSRTARHNVAPFPPKRTEPSCTCGPRKTRGSSVVCAGADQHTSLRLRQSRSSSATRRARFYERIVGLPQLGGDARRHVLANSFGRFVRRDDALETASPPARNRQPSHLTSSTMKRQPPSDDIGDSACTRAPMAAANSDTMASPRPDPNWRLGPRSAR